MTIKKQRKKAARQKTKRNMDAGRIRKFETQNTKRFGRSDSMTDFFKDNDNHFNNDDFGEQQMESEFKRIIFGR